MSDEVTIEDEALKGLDDLRCLVRNLEVSDRVTKTPGVWDIIEPYTTKMYFILDQLNELLDSSSGDTWDELRTEFKHHFRYSELSLEVFSNGYVILYLPPGKPSQVVVSTLGQFDSKYTAKKHGKSQLNWLKKHPDDVETLLRTPDTV